MLSILTFRIADGKQPKVSRLNRKVSISLKQIIALFLVIIIVVSLFFWASNRIAEHRNWATMVREAQAFRNNVDATFNFFSALFQNDTYSNEHLAVMNELHNAISSINELRYQDQAHTLQLSTIENFILNLRGASNLSGLNQSARINLKQIYLQIGSKVLYAYSGFINFTSINVPNGPPFWYFGPSPPDEPTLQGAVNFAIDADVIIKDYKIVKP